ncbi:MAG: helix-turn-helix transcriptional regulator [Actinobacteria bacterium]|nr:helix-turn-helix transcriptional regulator [Actinomycetota bacterium]
MVAAATDDARRLGRPTDADSGLTRERIIAAARIAFAERGYDATTNKQVADSAGITAAAIYHYFPSKVELFLAVCEAVEERFVQAFASPSGQADTVHARLSLMVERIEELNEEDHSLVRFLMGMGVEALLHPETKAAYVHSRRRIHGVVSEAIATSVDVAHVIPGTEPSTLADVFVATLSGMAGIAMRTDNGRRFDAGMRTFLMLLKSR